MPDMNMHEPLEITAAILDIQTTYTGYTNGTKTDTMNIIKMVQTGRHLNKKGWGTVVPRINVENAVAGG
jgi:hypothetical protein